MPPLQSQIILKHYYGFEEINDLERDINEVIIEFLDKEQLNNKEWKGYIKLQIDWIER